MNRPCLSYACEREKRSLQEQLRVARQRVHDLDRLAHSLQDRLDQVTAANRAHDTNDGRFSANPPPLPPRLHVVPTEEPSRLARLFSRRTP